MYLGGVLCRSIARKETTENCSVRREQHMECRSHILTNSSMQSHQRHCLVASSWKLQAGATATTIAARPCARLNPTHSALSLSLCVRALLETSNSLALLQICKLQFCHGVTMGLAATHEYGSIHPHRQSERTSSIQETHDFLYHSLQTMCQTPSIAALSFELRWACHRMSSISISANHLQAGPIASLHQARLACLFRLRCSLHESRWWKELHCT